MIEVADFMIGSPAALAEPTLERVLRSASTSLARVFVNILIFLRSAATKHALYVPTGALWGGEDIRKVFKVVESLEGFKVLKLLKIV